MCSSSKLVVANAVNQWNVGISKEDVSTQWRVTNSAGVVGGGGHNEERENERSRDRGTWRSKQQTVTMLVMKSTGVGRGGGGFICKEGIKERKNLAWGNGLGEGIGFMGGRGVGAG